MIMKKEIEWNLIITKILSSITIIKSLLNQKTPTKTF
jgi:hypothetical protein